LTTILRTSNFTVVDFRAELKTEAKSHVLKHENVVTLYNNNNNNNNYYYYYYMWMLSHCMQWFLSLSTTA